MKGTRISKRISVILLSMLVMISMMPLGVFADIAEGTDAAEVSTQSEATAAEAVEDQKAAEDAAAPEGAEADQTADAAVEESSEAAVVPDTDEEALVEAEEVPVFEAQQEEPSMDAAEAKTPVEYYDRDGNKQTLTEYVDLATVPIQSGGELYEENGPWYVLTSGKMTVSGRINIGGNVNLLICDGAELDANGGIHVGPGNELRIFGQTDNYQDADSLGKIVATATEGSENAGIGSDNEQSESGGIYIYGGRIEAKGDKYGAGIGGGDQSGAYVEIHGGSIDAEGGDYGAGIGGGDEAKNSPSINIYDGIVHAVGGYDAAGIGSGNEGAAPKIVIEDGDVDAHGGRYGAGIGGGDDSNGGKITINGGKVTGTSGPISTNITASGVAGAGIGGGRHGNAGSITINGGEVYAYGRKMAAGIGTGGDNDSMAYDGTDSEGCKGGVIRIMGGKVLATGKDEAGGSGDCRVTNDGGAGIGGGAESFGCLVIISGGHVEAVASGHGKRTVGHVAWSQEFAGDFGAAIGNGYAAESQGIVHLMGDGDQGPEIHVETTIGNPASGAEFGWTYDRVAAIGAAPDSNNCTVDIAVDWNYEVRTALWDDWTTRRLGKAKNVEVDKRLDAITGQADTWINTCKHAKKNYYSQDGYVHWFTCEHCGFRSVEEEHQYTGDWNIDPKYHYHTCTVCGHVEKQDHKYSQDEHKCEVCGRQEMVVTLEAGEGTGDAIEKSTATGESFQLPECTFTAPGGLTFLGWKKTAEGGEPVEATKVYKAGEYAYIFDNTTFTAVWGQLWSDIAQNVAGASSYGGVVRLAGDIYRTAQDGPIMVGQGEVTLDLSGHTVDIGNFTGADYGEGFYLLGGKLTIIDSSEDKTGKIVRGFGKEGHGGAVTVEKGATLVLEDGTITTNKANKGGGVLVKDGGTLELNGGKITGNIGTSDWTGSGVYAQKGSTINVSGSPEVRDNGSHSLLSSNISNVYLEDGVAFTVTGTLQPNAFIGFDLKDGMEGQVLVAKDLNGKGSKDSFGSDDRYSANVFDDGNLYAGKGTPVVRFLDETGTTEIMESMTVLQGAKLYLPTCSAVPPQGKAFAGWNDGTKSYKALETVTVTANMDFKCEWEDKQESEVNITVRPDGGSWEQGTASSDKNTIRTSGSDTDKTVRIIARPKRGNKFLRWRIWDWNSWIGMNSSRQTMCAATLKADNENAAEVTEDYLSDPTQEYATFTAGSSDIVIEAVFASNTISGIELSDESLDLTAGDTYQLSANVLPAGADQTVTWTSEDPQIATIDKNGNVTAVNPGLASITATAGSEGKEVTATCYVAVVAKCTVSFDSDGGTEVGSIDVGASGTIDRPADPEKAGHTFAAWRELKDDGTLADTDFDFGSQITSDITLKAVWKHDNLEYHEAAAPGCDTDGNAQYWYCSECNKYYADADATMEYAENAWIIKASHAMGQWENYDEAQHSRTCLRCKTHVEYEDHQWDGGVTAADGTITYTCQVCGATKTDTQDPTDAAKDASRNAEDKKAEAENLIDNAKSSVDQATKTAAAGGADQAAVNVAAGAQAAVSAAEQAVAEAVKAAEDAYNAASAAYDENSPEVQKASEELNNTCGFAEEAQKTINALKAAADSAAATIAANKTAAENAAAAQAAAEAQAKYAPGKVTIKKAKGAKKRVKVTWKTIKTGVTGYEIQIVKSKTGEVVKTVNVKQTKKLAKKKTINKTIKKLKKGKYKAQVRAYYTVDGNTYYGEWSKLKSFKAR